MTPLAAYHFISKQKYTLPVAKAHQLEKAYRVEQQYHTQALTEAKLNVPERFYRLTRRNQIFQAFRAKHYRNPVTRASIVTALRKLK
jgi:hypothetical protein